MESPVCPPVPDGTQLIETFGWWPGKGPRHLDLHLARMARSAAVLGFPWQEARARALLDLSSDTPLRCRLTLGSDGFALTTAALVPNPPLWRVGFADARLRSDDFWLGHKTTERAPYDQARANLSGGIDEVLFLNERGQLCEGTITNLFVTLQDGRKVTPALRAGVLPGVLRQSLLATGDWQAADLTPDDLRHARAIAMGNSLRGLIPAEILWDTSTI